MVPLVEAGDESCAQNCDRCPAQRPPRAGHDGQRGTPGAEKKEAECGVTNDVTGLANVEVPVLEADPIHVKKEVQDGIENPAGVVGGKIGSGFDGDHNQPQNRGDPSLQNFVAIGIQEQESGCARLDRQLLSPSELQRSELFDGIVWGLASDHDVVDMALAKSCAADAHKARFLQEFGNGGATAVAHA